MVAASTTRGCSLHHIWLQAVLDLIKTQERLARSGNYLEAQKIEKKVHENLRKDASSMQATPRTRTPRTHTRTHRRHAHDTHTPRTRHAHVTHAGHAHVTHGAREGTRGHA